jgi:hypothetical protein
MVSEAVDNAARCLLYKVYDATAGRADAWQVLGCPEERPEAVARAVERGWIIIRDDCIGRIKVRSGLLTGEGRRLAQNSRTAR